MFSSSFDPIPPIPLIVMALGDAPTGKVEDIVRQARMAAESLMSDWVQHPHLVTKKHVQPDSPIEHSPACVAKWPQGPVISEQHRFGHPMTLPLPLPTLPASARLGLCLSATGTSKNANSENDNRLLSSKKWDVK